MEFYILPFLLRLFGPCMTFPGWTLAGLTRDWAGAAFAAHHLQRISAHRGKKKNGSPAPKPPKPAFAFGERHTLVCSCQEAGVLKQRRCVSVSQQPGSRS